MTNYPKTSRLSNRQRFICSLLAALVLALGITLVAGAAHKPAKTPRVNTAMKIAGGGEVHIYVRGAFILTVREPSSQGWMGREEGSYIDTKTTTGDVVDSEGHFVKAIFVDMYRGTCPNGCEFWVKGQKITGYVSGCGWVKLLSGSKGYGENRVLLPGYGSYKLYQGDASVVGVRGWWPREGSKLIRLGPCGKGSCGNSAYLKKLHWPTSSDVTLGGW